MQVVIPITKHDHLIQQRISHHVLAISHHNMPCKNKLDVLYFVVASFTWLLRASSKNHSYLRIKTTTTFRQVCCFNLQQGPVVVKFDSSKVGETDTRQPPLCKTSCMSLGGTGIMNMVMKGWSGPLHPTIPPNQNKTLVVSSMTIIAHNSLCSTRAYHLRINLARMPLLGNVACNFKKIPTIMQDLSRRCIATTGGECVHVPS